MPYITQSGLVARYGETELIQLTDALGDGVIDAAVINRAIADADAEIDSYLSGLGILPLSPIPPALERRAAVMVRYYLYKDAAPDLVKEQYAESIRYLKDVAKGTAQLGPSDTDGATPATAAPSYSAPARAFDDTGMSGF